MLREALGSGVYAGQFTGPHRSPLHPHSGKVKPTPTRRPVVLSQEYIDNLNAHLIGAGISCQQMPQSTDGLHLQLFIVLGFDRFPGTERSVQHPHSRAQQSLQKDGQLERLFRRLRSLCAQTGCRVSYRHGRSRRNGNARPSQLQGKIRHQQVCSYRGIAYIDSYF